MNKELITIMFADGFEEVEALTAVDLLRRAGVNAATVSITGSKQVTGAHGIPVITDFLFGSIDFNRVKMIILPGGMPGTINLLNYDPLTSVLKAFSADDRPLAAICAAPMVLASHGILEGKKATIYKGMEDKLNGAIHTPGNVVKDGNIITSKGPGTAMDFGLALIEFLCGKDKAADIKSGLLYK